MKKKKPKRPHRPVIGGRIDKDVYEYIKKNDFDFITIVEIHVMGLLELKKKKLKSI